eukprot:NODE_27_length_33950_cov_0.349739.p22 type:complete len:106 gc:universal NODE_27_length_33950_cov_0.349739:12747-13064(+)
MSISSLKFMISEKTKNFNKETERHSICYGDSSCLYSIQPGLDKNAYKCIFLAAIASIYFRMTVCDVYVFRFIFFRVLRMMHLCVVNAVEYLLQCSSSLCALPLHF